MMVAAKPAQQAIASWVVTGQVYAKPCRKATAVASARLLIPSFS